LQCENEWPLECAKTRLYDSFPAALPVVTIDNQRMVVLLAEFG
jgi:hypothetical protein